MKIKRLLLIFAVVSVVNVSAPSPWGAAKRWWNNRKKATRVSSEFSSSSEGSPVAGARSKSKAADLAHQREAGMRILTSPKPAKVSPEAWGKRQENARELVHRVDKAEAGNKHKVIPLDISGFRTPA